ncbi:hypothetical protein SEA_KEELAN_147 [Gordonia phage Keelan]|nr:hypothetical protein SEA_KEELAN_147 [Gordonia phage Keelan]
MELGTYTQNGWTIPVEASYTDRAGIVHLQWGNKHTLHKNTKTVGAQIISSCACECTNNECPCCY